MASFTIELFRAIELAPNRDIGLNDYPIFDANYREGLNEKIVRHYWMREIGVETIDMFRFSMRRRMHEIMPLYNKLYESERMVFDPLKTMDIQVVNSTTSNMESEGKSESTSVTDNESGSRAVQSQTPQVPLSGNADYATSAADTTSKSKANGTGSESSESATTENASGESRTSGYQGSGASLIMEYRRSLLNIDMLIIDELQDLFMGVWDSGNDHLPYPFTDLPSLY